MASYHLTPTGPRACSTTPDRCPYGRAGGEHFDNVADAQNSFEKTMEATHGLVGRATASKNRDTELYRLYSKLERLEKDNAAYKRIAQIASYKRHVPSRKSHKRYKPSGRSRVTERMRRAHPGRRVSRMITRGGKQMFKSVGPTPKSIVRLHRYMTKSTQNSVK